MINTLQLDYKSLRRTRKVNGERVIEFEVFPTDKNKFFFDLVVEETVIEFKNDEYVVKKLEEKSIGKTYFKQVTAVHKFYVDMINKQQPQIHNGSITFNNYMKLVFEDTGYTFEVIDQFNARSFENLGNDNRLALLQKGLDRFKAEFELVDNNKKARIRKMIGRDTDFQFRFGHNIKAINRNIDTTNLATKIAGTGDPELDIKASYTSPNVAIFGEIDAPPVNDERFKSQAALLEEMKSRLIDEPEVSITVDFVDLRAAGYPYAIPNEGDRIWLIYEPMDGLLIETRILEINEVFDKHETVKRTEVTLSNHRKSFAGTLFESVQKQLDGIINDDGVIKYNALDEAVRIATESLQSAQTELEFNNGIIAREKTDPNRLVLLNSAGIGISKDGGHTFTEAITADGFVLTAGAIGRLSANNIQIGPETYYGGEVFDKNHEYVVDGDRTKTENDLTLGSLYETTLDVSDINIGDKFKLSFDIFTTENNVNIALSTDLFSFQDNYILHGPIFVSPSLNIQNFELEFEVNKIPDSDVGTSKIWVGVSNFLDFQNVSGLGGFSVSNVSLKKTVSAYGDPEYFDDWIDKEITEGATGLIEVADGVLREDLRLESRLPTSLKLDMNGITAYTVDPNKYARLDYRGLYIKGGAIQIDGGLSDDQIDSSDQWNTQGTYIDDEGIYTGTITANQVQVGFNNIGSQVKVSSTGLSTYSGGLRTSLLNGSGHRFYRDGYSIGYIGTNKYVGTSLRGLDFNLEYEAHNMTWGAKLSPDDNDYSVLLAWDRDSSMGIKGFSFSDVVTFNEDVTFRDDVTFNFGFKLRTNGYAKSYTNAVEWGVNGSNYNITQYDNGRINFYMGSSTVSHAFFPDGTKSGGSIEIGNEILGMSPVDSPQILIEYIEFDIKLSKEGTIVYLDEEYLEAVSNYAVFLNKGEVIEKADDYFVVIGEGLADARIVGKRIKYEEAFWGDMKSLEKPQKENEPQMRVMSTQNTQDDKIKGFWKKQKARKTIHEEVNGKTMKKVYRKGPLNEN